MNEIANSNAASAPGFRWLRTGEQCLDRMLDLIANARRSIHLEMYIFSPGEIGVRFREALVAARMRGVRVQVLVDALGSLTLPASFWEPLIKIGGEFRWFNPLSLERLAFRDHRKILVVDAERAVVGGFNIAPEYDGDGVSNGWRDLGIEITGPLGGALAESMEKMWAAADFRHRRLPRLRKRRDGDSKSDGRWQLLLSGPGRDHHLLKRTLAHDIARAKSVKILCAYFLPPRRLRKELMRAARRGAKVQLILPGRSDVQLSLLASRRLYSRLLRAGVEIYEYQPQILHAKMVIIDGLVYAGSANLDVRSLGINYELLVRVSDPALTREGVEIFNDDLPHCLRIDDRAAWRRSRTVWQKLKERWAYFLLARVDPYFARLQAQSAPRS